MNTPKPTPEKLNWFAAKVRRIQERYWRVKAKYAAAAPGNPKLSEEEWFALMEAKSGKVRFCTTREVERVLAFRRLLDLDMIQGQLPISFDPIEFEIMQGVSEGETVISTRVDDHERIAAIGRLEAIGIANPITLQHNTVH